MTQSTLPRYDKLPDGQWKAYIQLFTKKGTKQRLFVKPGITAFWDGDARMYFNDLTEQASFKQHFDTKVLWSEIFPDKQSAKVAEKYLLEYFGDPVDIGFKTSGGGEVRAYDHEKWNNLRDKLYKRKVAK